jgi:nucleotide-binding universal stress UspA family protein
MRKILVPVDLSEMSLAVITQASCFGQSPVSTLWLLHVVPPTNPSPPFNLDRKLWRTEIAKGLHEQRRQLRELAEQLRREHIRVFTRFIAGTVSTVILAEARRLHADLIIMGSHGHGNVYHALLGGVGQRVMRKASCPVMLVFPEKNRFDWRLLWQGSGSASRARAAKTPPEPRV